MGSGWFWLVVVVILAIIVPPLVQARLIRELTLGEQRVRRRRRRELNQRLGQIERKRRSRIIALVHRDEPFEYRMIDIEDSEDVLAAIRDTPSNKPIEMIVHTPGGMGLASLQIARALKAHPAKKTVFVPHWAMSGGTLIALAADEIVMSEHAVLGPVDPQLGYPAVSILKPLEMKPAAAVDDFTIILADVAKKVIAESRKEICDLLLGKLSEEGACSVADDLISGKYFHGHAVTVDDARQIGLKVSTDMPREIIEVLELFPRQERQSSVKYTRSPND